MSLLGLFIFRLNRLRLARYLENSGACGLAAFEVNCAFVERQFAEDFCNMFPLNVDVEQPQSGCETPNLETTYAPDSLGYHHLRLDKQYLIFLIVPILLICLGFMRRSLL